MPEVTHAPNAFEQEQLELVNRARTDPSGQYATMISSGLGVQSNITLAVDYFGVDLSTLQSQLAALTAAAPLAWNDSLASAADGHSQAMIAADTQSHQVSGEAALGARATAAGYNWTYISENVYAYTDDPVQGHAGFMIDWGYDDSDIVGGSLISNWQTNGDGIQDRAGHRVNIMNTSVTEIGISSIAENDNATNVGPYVVTQNFGNSFNYQAQLLGVVIRDADSDNFYDMGEGLGGVTVTATGSAGTYSTTTWSAGGYQMELPAGSYTVTFSGGGLSGAATYSVTMGTENTKLDGFAADAAAVPTTLDGTSADDTLTGTNGTDQILTGNGGSDQLNAADGDDLLIGDTLHVGLTSVAEQVYRLYGATLNRVPDTAGHFGWVEAIVTGTSTLAQAAAGFVASAEFQNTYGALDDTGFVTLMYNNVLGRAPDSGGLTGWTTQLASGASRESVVLGFSESTEYVQTTLSAALAFAASGTAAVWADDIYRLYQATLGREPDAGGFVGWITQLGLGRAFSEVAAGFVASTEFQNTYGALDDTGFVTLLYNNVLGRDPESSGLTGWTTQLASGTSREAVVEGFSQSGEFITATTDALETYMRNLGQDDLLSPGAGNDTLMGGALSDVFLFDAAQDGSNTITDFEPWDVFRLTGFGYSDVSEAQGFLSTQGSDVVFSDQGVSVTLNDVALADVQSALELI